MFDKGYSDAMYLNVPVHPDDSDYMMGWQQAIDDDQASIDDDYHDEEVDFDDDDY